MLTHEQHRIRSTGIGSSEIGVIAGFGAQTANGRTVHDIYCQKRGLVEPIAESLPMRVGHLVEGLIADLYSEEIGEPIETPAQAKVRGTLRHPERSWQVATPDRLLLGGDTVLEIKWVGWRMAHNWSHDEDGVPPYVMCQAQWLMDVTSREHCDVAAIIGGDEFRIYRLTRHERLLASLREAGERFWFDNVLAGEPPPIDGSEGARRMLEALFVEHRPPLKDAPAEASELVDQLLTVKAWAEAAERFKTERENRLAEMIGEADGMMGTWGKLYWKRARGHSRRTLRLYPRKDKAA